jgi:hypothetical protein
VGSRGNCPFMGRALVLLQICLTIVRFFARI